MAVPMLCKMSMGFVGLQETTHTHDLPENLRRRIIEYFKYKYRDGKLRNQEAVLHELPYDMQASHHTYCCQAV